MSLSSEPLKSDSPLPCPGCGKLFRLPTGFTASHSLACPHCQQQVTGQQILDALVPTATIIEGANQPSPAHTPKTPGSSSGRRTLSFDEQDFVIPKPLKTATRRSSRRHPERRSGIQRDSSNETQRSESNSSSSQSRRQPETNAGKEFFKIILGGLLALPIAQLLLWWALNLDPLGLSAATHKVVPFVVPPKLRPAEVIETDDEPKSKPGMPPSQRLNDDDIPISILPG